MATNQLTAEWRRRQQEVEQLNVEQIIHELNEFGWEVSKITDGWEVRSSRAPLSDSGLAQMLACERMARDYNEQTLEHLDARERALDVGSHRLAWQNPDWNDDSKAYDCFTLPLENAEVFLNAIVRMELDGPDAEATTFAAAARNELADLHAIFDAWLESRRGNSK